MDLLTEFLDSLRTSQVRQKAEPAPKPPTLEISLVGATRDDVQRQIDVCIRFCERGGGLLEAQLGPVSLKSGDWGAIVRFYECAL